jgi:hypothetical protein
MRPESHLMNMLQCLVFFQDGSSPSQAGMAGVLLEMLNHSPQLMTSIRNNQQRPSTTSSSYIYPANKQTSKPPEELHREPKADRFEPEMIRFILVQNRQGKTRLSKSVCLPCPPPLSRIFSPTSPGQEEASKQAATLTGLSISGPRSRPT